MDPDALSLLAVEAAQAAGAELILRARRGGVEVETKSNRRDLVTDADRASEGALLDLLDRRPEDGIVSEEGTTRPSTSGLTWVLDPLDGTTNFVYGRPRWCVSLACVDAEGELVGCTFDPIKDELFLAARGGGATKNGETISVTAASSLEDALIGTGFSYDLDLRHRQGELLAKIVGRVLDVRRAGAPCLDLADVACGRIDGFYETLDAPWDRAAGTLLVREAGGVVAMEPGAVGRDQVVAAGANLFPLLSEAVRA